MPCIGTQTPLCTRRRTHMHRTARPGSRTALVRSPHYRSNCTWSRLVQFVPGLWHPLAVLVLARTSTHTFTRRPRERIVALADPAAWIGGIHGACTLQGQVDSIFTRRASFVRTRTVMYPSSALCAIEHGASSARRRTFTRVSSPLRVAFTLAAGAFATPRAHGTVAAAWACILARGT